MEFRPSSVKNLLEEMMNKASLQLDLAIASLATNDVLLAERVLDIEEELDELVNQLYIHAALSARSPKEASDILIYFHIGNATNTISDIAGNIAELVIERINPFKGRNTIFLFMHEFIDSVKITTNSILTGKNEEDLMLQDIFGIDIMAIKREDKILLGFKHTLEPNDILFLRGSSTNVPIFSELARGHINDMGLARAMLNVAKIEESQNNLFPHEEKFIKMLNSAMLIIDLGFLTHINTENTLLDTIQRSENFVDSLHKDIIKDVLKASHELKISEIEALGMLKLASEIEMLADAGYYLAFGVDSTGESKLNLLKKVMEDTEESFEINPIIANSPYVGKTIHEAELETKLSEAVFDVEVLKRRNEIIQFPKDDIVLKTGDILFVKYYNNAEEFKEEDEELEKEITF